MTELVVVPSERHVERLAREGVRAETRTSLRSRLLAALLPDVALADARQCRLALAMALASPGDAPARPAPAAAPPPPSPARTPKKRGSTRPPTDAAPARAQLDLFAAAAAAGVSDDPLLAALRAGAGASWVRTVDALDRALADLRARGADATLLEAVASRTKGVVASRARVLALAMRALDARLTAASLCDARTGPWLLARAIARLGKLGEVAPLLDLLAARRVRARWVLAWEPADLAWFRALDDALARAGGDARIVLPAVDRPLEGTRERDAFEVLADDVARALDAAPEPEIVPAVLGDVTSGTAPPVDLSRVRLLGASDATAQARGVVQVVREALLAGVVLEKIAVAVPVNDERTLVPLRRALADAGIVTFEARGAPMSSSPAVAAALGALETATTLDRIGVARLAASGYVDPERLAPGRAERREAHRALARAAQKLEASPTAEGADAVKRLARTVSTEPSLEAELVIALAERLAAAAPASTRGERVRAARALWASLGIGLRAGRGGLASFTRDEAPRGVARAERLAIARDTRAWDALATALDAYEAAAQAMSGLDQVVSAEVFRLEIKALLDDATGVPGAGRAGALRIARLADVPGEELDLLVVIDVNEGVLPRDLSQDALVSEGLAEALERVSQGRYKPRDTTVTRARQLAALAAGAAESSVVTLCFTREDAAGAPLAPSPVVDFLERAGAVVSAPPPSDPMRAAPSARLRARRERAREAFFLDPERPRSDLVAALAGSPSIAEILTRETGGGARALAVTALERFARCAFQGYAYAVLAARELERREERPDAREEGNLVHDALAAAFSATAAEWPARPRDGAGIRERAVAAADAVLARETGHAPLRAVTRLRVRDAVRAVLDAAIADETWDFAFAERSFGGARRRPGEAERTAEEPWPPLVLDDGATRVTLRGGIDRIDLTHDKKGARVVDYKRSKSTVTSSTASLGETALQIPLYACVVARRTGLHTTGAYMPTQPRDLADEASGRGSARARERIEELVARDESGLAEIEKRVLVLLRRARGGDLVPLPHDDSECQRCAVSGACRKPRFAMTPAEDEEEGAS